MGFFKYKWQVILAIAMVFSWMLLLNALAFKFLDTLTIALAYLFGFVFSVVIYFIRKKEAWLKKLS